MTNGDETGRPQPPFDGDELATLLGFLEHQRATLAWKASGLDAAGLSATVGASTMTLGGMLKHLAYVEDFWLSHRLLGRPPQHPWDAVDWDADNDWDWHSAAEDSPEHLRALWAESVDRSRAAVAEFLRDGAAGTPSRGASSRGVRPSLRWIACHMIEEYARHNGHADLLRESVDGQTGD